MSNPNNLIRPPVLNPLNSSPTPNPAIAAPSVQTIQNITPDIIARIVQDVIATQFQGLLQANSQQFSDFANFSDQTIDPSLNSNISDYDKIPDVVRCLRDFSGNPGEFSSWKKSVDRILQIYEPIRGTSKYYGILNIIRNKIIGNADIALESYNTPLNWKAIAKCLTLHYADKRDIRTLEYQMISLVQGNQTVQEFYGQVYTQLSLILNKIGCMDLTDEPLKLFTQSYRDKALDTFVRGLNGDLSRLLGMKEPVDLPQALHLCLKLENQNFRSDYAHRSKNIPNGILNHQNKEQKPRFQQKNNQNQFQNNQKQFHPQLAYIPHTNVNSNNQNYQAPWQNQNAQYNGNNYQQKYYRPQRPTAPKPQPRPEPMDVDQSLRSKGVNYMNRPKHNNFAGKRPPPSPFHVPTNKVQRNFYLDAHNPAPDGAYYEEHPPEEGEVDTSSENGNSDYSREYYQQVADEILDFANQEEQPVDTSDLHFLG